MSILSEADVGGLTGQVLVVLPPGAAGNAHPIFALQVGAATACAPVNR